MEQILKKEENKQMQATVPFEKSIIIQKENESGSSSSFAEDQQHSSRDPQAINTFTAQIINKIDLYQPLDVIDETQEERKVDYVDTISKTDLEQQSVQSSNNQASSQSFFNNYQFGKAANNVQPPQAPTVPIKKQSSFQSYSFQKAASSQSIDKPPTSQEVKPQTMGQTERIMTPKKIQTHSQSSFGQGGGSFSNYSIKVASQQEQVSEKPSQAPSSFARASSFGQGYSFGQQQAVAVQQQKRETSSFNTPQNFKEYNINSSSASYQTNNDQYQNKPPLIGIDVSTPRKKDSALLNIIAREGSEQQYNTSRSRGTLSGEEKSQLEVKSIFKVQSCEGTQIRGAKRKHHNKGSIQNYQAEPSKKSHGTNRSFKATLNATCRLDALDLPENRGLMNSTLQGTQFDGIMQEGNALHSTMRAGFQENMDANPMSQTFKGIDHLGDFSQMNSTYAQNEILNQTHSNLLSYTSGKQLKQERKRAQSRCQSVFVGFEEQTKIQQELMQLRAQMAMQNIQDNNTQMKLPPMRGYGDAGNSQFTSAALRSQFQPKGAPQGESQQATQIEGFAAPMTAAQQQRLQEAGLSDMGQFKQMDEQMRIFEEEQTKLFQRIQESQEYLKKLRTSKSHERLKKSNSVSKKVSDGNTRFEKSPNLSTNSQNTTVRELKSEFRLRQSSEDSLSLVGLVQFNHYKFNIMKTFMISRAEIEELRSTITLLIKGSGFKFMYYHVILKNVRNLIDFFVDQPNEELLQIKTMKEIIHHFERLQTDLNRRIQMAQESTKSADGATSSKTPTDSVSPRLESENQTTKQNYSLSHIEIWNLKYIFFNLRYIFTKFGRVINYQEKINAGWKRFLLKLEMQKMAPQRQDSSNKVSAATPPPKQDEKIKRIIDQQRKDQPSKNKNDLNILSYKSFVPNEKKIFPSRYDCLIDSQKSKDPQSTFQYIDVTKVLTDLPIDDKCTIIEHEHKKITAKWKKIYDEQRVKNIPTFMCRICEREVFADLEQIHTVKCDSKIKKSLAQKDINTAFRNLYNQATKLIVEQSSFTSQIGLKNSQVLQTPTIQRRNINPTTQQNSIPIQQQRFRAFSLTGTNMDFNSMNKIRNLFQKNENELNKSPKNNPLTGYCVNKAQNPADNNFVSHSHEQMLGPEPPKPFIPQLNFSSLAQKLEQDQQTGQNQDLEVIEEEIKQDGKQEGKNSGNSQATSKSLTQMTDVIDIGQVKFKFHDEVLRVAREKGLIMIKKEKRAQTQYPDRVDYFRNLQKQVYTFQNLQLKNPYLTSRSQIGVDFRKETLKTQNQMMFENQNLSQVVNKNLKKKFDVKMKVQAKLDEQIDFEEDCGRIKRLISCPKHLEKQLSKRGVLSANYKLPDHTKQKKTLRPLKKASKISITRFQTHEHCGLDKTQTSLNMDKKSELSRSIQKSMNASGHQSTSAFNASQKYQERKLKNEIKGAIKQEMEIMECLKKLAQSCEEMSQLNHSYKHQINIYQHYSQNLQLLENMKHEIDVNPKVYQFIIKFNAIVERKIVALKELAEIEVEILKTLPQKEIEKMNQSLKQYENVLEKFKNLAISHSFMNMQITKMSNTNKNSSGNVSQFENTSIMGQSRPVHQQFRRMSVVATMGMQNKLQSQMQMSRLQGTSYSRRGSTVYSQFSLLSEYDSDALKSKLGHVTKQSGSNEASQFGKERGSSIFEQSSHNSQMMQNNLNLSQRFQFNIDNQRAEASQSHFGKSLRRSQESNLKDTNTSISQLSTINNQINMMDTKNSPGIIIDNIETYPQSLQNSCGVVAESSNDNNSPTNKMSVGTGSDKGIFQESSAINPQTAQQMRTRFKSSQKKSKFLDYEEMSDAKSNSSENQQKKQLSLQQIEEVKTPQINPIRQKAQEIQQTYETIEEVVGGPHKLMSFAENTKPKKMMNDTDSNCSLDKLSLPSDSVSSDSSGNFDHQFDEGINTGAQSQKVHKPADNLSKKMIPIQFQNRLLPKSNNTNERQRISISNIYVNKSTTNAFAQNNTSNNISKQSSNNKTSNSKTDSANSQNNQLWNKMLNNSQSGNLSIKKQQK